MPFMELLRDEYTCVGALWLTLHSDGDAFWRDLEGLFTNVCSVMGEVYEERKTDDIALFWRRNLMCYSL